MTKILLSAEPSLGEVVVTGVGVVFIGLVAIIGILYLMSYIVGKLEGNAKAANAPAQSPVQAPVQKQGAPAGVIENRSEIVAAVCAAVAEENGTDISAIRVVSFKKV